jgi:DNA transposition AAA+ family ATPase
MNLKSQYSMIKLQTRSDAETGVTDDKIKNLNEKIFESYNKNNFISGYYAVETGMEFIGFLDVEPKIGLPIILRGDAGLQTSAVREIMQETENKWTIKTQNSFYLLKVLPT